MMPYPYTEHKRFRLRLSPKDGQYLVHYWRIGTDAVYETMLADTPKEARRMARLTIASLATLPNPLQRYAPAIDRAIERQFGSGGPLGGA